MIYRALLTININFEWLHAGDKNIDPEVKLTPVDEVGPREVSLDQHLLLRTLRNILRTVNQVDSGAVIPACSNNIQTIHQATGTQPSTNVKFLVNKTSIY